MVCRNWNTLKYMYRYLVAKTIDFRGGRHGFLTYFYIFLRQWWAAGLSLFRAKALLIISFSDSRDRHDPPEHQASTIEWVTLAFYLLMEEILLHLTVWYTWNSTKHLVSTPQNTNMEPENHSRKGKSSSKPSFWSSMLVFFGGVPSGKLTARPWKSASFLVNTINMVDFPASYVSFWGFISISIG